MTHSTRDLVFVFAFAVATSVAFMAITQNAFAADAMSHDTATGGGAMGNQHSPSSQSGAMGHDAKSPDSMGHDSMSKGHMSNGDTSSDHMAHPAGKTDAMGHDAMSHNSMGHPSK